MAEPGVTFASSPATKRLRLDPETETEHQSNDTNMATLPKTRVVLALCGSFSPVTNLHLRMFGRSSLIWDL